MLLCGCRPSCLQIWQITRKCKKEKFRPQVEGGFTTPIGDPSYDLLETKIVTPEGENKSRVYRLQVEFTFD